MMSFTPRAWYWSGRPAGHASDVIYSSAEHGLVDAAHPDYVKWLDAGFRPTQWPRDDDGVATTAALDEVLVSLGLPESGLTSPTAARLAPLIKTECGRRIYAVVSDNAQKNTLANVLAGALTGADLDTWKAAVAWIGEMQEAARALIAALDTTYAEDAHWPAVPIGVAALAARF